MSNATNFTTEGSCYAFSTEQYVAVAALSACTGMVSVVASLIVIIGILVFKKYLFFIQRLILYLSIAVLLNAVSIVLRLQRVVILYGNNDHLHPLCVFTSFMDQTTAWSELIAICCISCSLLLNVLLLRSVEKLEVVYALLIFVLPLLFNWIPFIMSSYGEAGAWCWIRNVDEDCNNFTLGSYLRFILWYAPLYVILFILVASYVVIVYRVQTLRRKWGGMFDPEINKKKEKMRSELCPVIWYPLIYLILNIFPLMNRIHDATGAHPELTLWIFHAFFSPLKGGFIALAYALDSETVRRLGCFNGCALLRWMRADNKVTVYPSTKAHSDSFRQEESTEVRRSHPYHMHENAARLVPGVSPQLGHPLESSSPV